MSKFKPRQISIIYPPDTSIEKFVLFGFSVYYKVLEDGCLETIIEETEGSQKFFSSLLRGLQEEELYSMAEQDFEQYPELETIMAQIANAFP